MTTRRKPAPAEVPELSAVQKELSQLRAQRKNAAEIKEWLDAHSVEIAEHLAAVDPDDTGVLVDETDQNKGAAFFQHNEASTVWDTEAIIAWLAKRPRRRASCYSLVLDIKKWEAEVANGNIPKGVANDFLTKKDRPAPFVRWGKITDATKSSY